MGAISSRRTGATRAIQALETEARFWLFRNKFGSETMSGFAQSCHTSQREKGFPAGNRLQECMSPAPAARPIRRRTSPPFLLRSRAVTPHVCNRGACATGLEEARGDTHTDGDRKGCSKHLTAKMKGTAMCHTQDRETLAAPGSQRMSPQCEGKRWVE